MDAASPSLRQFVVVVHDSTIPGESSISAARSCLAASWSVKDTCKAFAAAGFHQDALEQVRETWPISLADFLGQVDTFRHADTTMRNLTEDEFLRGKERLRRAVRHADDTANPEPRSNWPDLLVLR